MPTTENTTGYMAFTAGEALEAHRRVKISAATVVYADADAVGIGVTQHACANAGLVTVKLWSAPGTFMVEASAAIAAGAALLATADGKVDDGDAGALLCPISALQSASAGGNIIDANLELTRDTPNVGATTSAADALAIPITHRVVAKTTGGDAEALTLANGTPGQRLLIYLAVDGGGDGTLTPTTKTGFATIVFADAKDNVDLEYVDNTIGWIIVGAAGVTAPPVIS